jgi:hypothetical protein
MANSGSKKNLLLIAVAAACIVAGIAFALRSGGDSGPAIDPALQAADDAARAMPAGEPAPTELAPAVPAGPRGGGRLPPPAGQ